MKPFQKGERPMNTRRLKQMLVAVPVMACALLLIALATPAAAQSEACVHLQVGSGYAATMQVNFENAVIGPSGSFAIGQTKCESLAAVPDGIDFSVQVNAILGEAWSARPRTSRALPRSQSQSPFMPVGSP
jgi:hypothetical protein